MPLKLEVKRKLLSRSERVKCVDFHPKKPWMLASLYNGELQVWNYSSQKLVKSTEVSDVPVRTAKFIARKNWIVTGSDDMRVSIFNYNTLEKLHEFDAHFDYIRCIVVHPTQPFIFTTSDDNLMKMWNWEKDWEYAQPFEGHKHYVMQVAINPKDNNTLATASLDKTVKVWQLGSNKPNFTLEGHEKGVNCVNYHYGGDKPYLISGSDDRSVRIWDYQNKTCVHTLEGHAQNISVVLFHPELPIIITGSEDGTVRLWHGNTYRLESALNYGLERIWAISPRLGTNYVALGYDEGSMVIQLGREQPAMSMDASGRIVWAKHSELQQANLKLVTDAEVKDGERIPLQVRDMGTCEIYPQVICHNPNGRFVAIVGDGEYIIYTSMALRNRSFGTGQELVWAYEPSDYAVRESPTSIKFFKNFKESRVFQPDYAAEGMFGGYMLGVRSHNGLAFYDWDAFDLIRRIEIQPNQVLWSESGELVCIIADDSFYVLQYNAETVIMAKNSEMIIPEDGLEDAFEVVAEIQESVKTGLWIGDCFVYTNSINRLNYFVGGEIVTVSHLDTILYILGYVARDNRLYLGDKDFKVFSFTLELSILEYQTAVLRKDFEVAQMILPSVPVEQHIRVAYFLEKHGFKSQAMAVSPDPEHKFELAMQLGELEVAYELAKEAGGGPKWKQLADLATSRCRFELAKECLQQAKDYGGLLLLATSMGNVEMMEELSHSAESSGIYNVAFMSAFVLGDKEKALDVLLQTHRIPEAAFFARTYLPSQVPRVLKLWKENVAKVNAKAAEALADPNEYENLFPSLSEAVKAEEFMKKKSQVRLLATSYPSVAALGDRDAISEMKSAEAAGDIADVKQSSDESENIIPSMTESEENLVESSSH